MSLLQPPQILRWLWRSTDLKVKKCYHTTWNLHNIWIVSCRLCTLILFIIYSCHHKITFHSLQMGSWDRHTKNEFWGRFQDSCKKNCSSQGRTRFLSWQGKFRQGLSCEREKGPLEQQVKLFKLNKSKYTFILQECCQKDILEGQQGP